MVGRGAVIGFIGDGDVGSKYQKYQSKSSTISKLVKGNFN